MLMKTEKNTPLKNEIRFIGSAKFTASFLNKLVGNLSASGKDIFEETKKVFRFKTNFLSEKKYIHIT